MLQTRHDVSCNLAAMRVLGLMPFLFFCAVAVYLRSHERSHVQGWRNAAIVSGIVTGVWVVAGCELLGLFKAVSFWPLVVWWTVPIVVLAWRCRAWRPRKPEFPKDWLLVAVVCAAKIYRKTEARLGNNRRGDAVNNLLKLGGLLITTI